MKIIGICESCKTKKFFIRKRVFKIPKTDSQTMTSQSELCKNCFKAISSMLK